MDNIINHWKINKLEKFKTFSNPLLPRGCLGPWAGQGSAGLGLYCVDDLTPPAVRRQTDSRVVFTKLPRIANLIWKAFALICAEISSDCIELPPPAECMTGVGQWLLSLTAVVNHRCPPELFHRAGGGEGSLGGGRVCENISFHLAEM